ncbi:MAG: long-chain-fatty-acid--CoA ligase [Deferrisomatales bacterium]
MAGGALLQELCRYATGTWADILYRNALLYPDREAFIYGGERVTFAGYNARVNRLVHALHALGVKKGDGIGALAWNCLEYAVLYGAAMKGGFILSPFNPRLQTGELEYLIGYSEAATLFVGGDLAAQAEALRPRLPEVRHWVSLDGPRPAMADYRELLAGQPEDEPGVDVRPEDPYVIFYTSGTTGTPRGALYAQGRNIHHTRTRVLLLNLVTGDKHVMILPLFHVGGTSQFWAFFYIGGSNVILPQKSFDPGATLRVIADERATDLHIVPTHLVTLLGVPEIDACDLTSLKRMWYAASPMPTELLRRGIERFGPIFMQGYGQSETGPDITFLSMAAHDVLDRPAEEQGVLASCGQPCPGVHVRLVDDAGRDVGLGEVGEIVVRSGSLMLEYWRRPEETRQVLRDGWLHTGDLGRHDETCHLYIVGRKKEMIISGGENVYPREVEEVLYQHPAVAEVAVIGLPDPVWVERVHGVVALAQGREANADELIRFCKQRLASYKVPKTFEFVAALPKNATGKILKRELLAQRTP